MQTPDLCNGNLAFDTEFVIPLGCPSEHTKQSPGAAFAHWLSVFLRKELKANIRKRIEQHPWPDEHGLSFSQMATALLSPSW